MARRAAGEAQRLDHHPGLRPPQPGAAGDDRMRHRQGQGAAGQRQTFGQQPAAELGQEPVRAGRGAGFVHQPSEGRRQSLAIHTAIMPPRPWSVEARWFFDSEHGSPRSPVSPPVSLAAPAIPIPPPSVGLRKPIPSRRGASFSIPSSALAQRRCAGTKFWLTGNRSVPVFRQLNGSILSA